MKRIITCSDGTWNKPNTVEDGTLVRTNVQQIFAALDKMDVRDQTKSTDQLKFYDEGVGAEGNLFTRVLSGATGKGIDENILAAYKFIVWNYEPGDELYLFGFSRGAYTARSLAGLIRNCGILKNNDLNLINQAYAIYRDRNDPKYAPNGELAMKFKQGNAYSFDKDNFRIKMIGVWDTVGALGIPLSWYQWYNKKKYAFHDTQLSSMVEYAYQALAIDEKRGNFVPSIWQKSDSMRKAENSISQIMDQCWFAGVHANIGGGYPDKGLSDIALQWMIEKASAVGLSFDQEYLNKNIDPCAKGTLYNSNIFPYNLSRSYKRKVDETCFANEHIHQTAFDRMKLVTDYKPRNLVDKLQNYTR